ncbi:MAG: aminopeptidase [Kiritimatiellae bacterium]|nr:aminopeptidase [Kiritimatiellia bacterium]
MDPRVKNLARTLVKYSLDVKPGMSVSVGGTAAAEPLFVALYEELINAGAYPTMQMMPTGCHDYLMKNGKPHHFNKVSPAQRAMIKNVDASIRIISESNTRALSSVNPARQATLAKTSRALSNIMLKKPWVLTLFPTEAYAQDAEMSLRDFEDFVYQATYSNETNPIAAWRKVRRDQDKLIAKLKGAREVRIVGPGTDLTFSVAGRTFINSPGTHNMPSGEIFTGPVETSANGTIQYDYPVCNGGREIDGIRLVFKDGVVVEASATKNEKYLLTMLDMDPGARRLGEWGIGTNWNIQRFIKNILFDEKIGGTIHLALGKSYPETGGVNQSSLHWDIIKDLRKGGAIYVDGKVFQKDGVFNKRF